MIAAAADGDDDYNDDDIIFESIMSYLQISLGAPNPWRHVQLSRPTGWP